MIKVWLLVGLQAGITLESKKSFVYATPNGDGGWAFALSTGCEKSAEPWTQELC
jgi:hypothetical protein